MFVAVPNYLANEIYARIDAQLELCPEVKPHRQDIFRDLVGYFDEHGVIPEFTLAPGKVAEAEADCEHD